MLRPFPPSTTCGGASTTTATVQTYHDATGARSRLTLSPDREALLARPSYRLIVERH
jgi:hypothetical protein